MSKKIGNIIKSSSQLEYIVQVLNPKEEAGLKPSDYALGSFLFLDSSAVGIIYDTELFNPHSLSLSSQKEEIKVFAPDLQDEVDILLKVLLLGYLENNYGNQNLPTEPLEAGSSVMSMTEEQIKQFHLNAKGGLQVRYLLNLNNFGNKLNPGLLNCIAQKLKNILTKSQFQIIEVIERDLLWTHLCKTN